MGNAPVHAKWVHTRTMGLVDFRKEGGMMYCRMNMRVITVSRVQILSAFEIVFMTNLWVWEDVMEGRTMRKSIGGERNGKFGIHSGEELWTNHIFWYLLYKNVNISIIRRIERSTGSSMIWETDRRKDRQSEGNTFVGASRLGIMEPWREKETKTSQCQER